jgi:hypothetical protein
MEKSELIHALQTEIRRHSFDVFVDEPPVMAEGIRGVGVPGCPVCRKRISSMAQFVDPSLMMFCLPQLRNCYRTDEVRGASYAQGGRI